MVQTAGKVFGKGINTENSNNSHQMTNGCEMKASSYQFQGNKEIRTPSVHGITNTQPFDGGQESRTAYRDPGSPADGSPGHLLHSHQQHSTTYIPPEIKQNLIMFRRAQGKRQLGNRLQNILERSRRKHMVRPQNNQPIR